MSDDAAATVSSNVSDLTKPSINNKWIPQTLLRSHHHANGNLSRTQEDKDNDVFRRCRALLNKLTPEKFDKLADDLANPAFGIDSPHLLKGVILLIFDKALAEPNYCSLCKWNAYLARYSDVLSHLKDKGERALFFCLP